MTTSFEARAASKSFQKEGSEALKQPVIRAIICNLDGVITGKKTGFNFPNPHQYELNALRGLQMRGIPVIFCTAKFNYPVRRIVQLANLNNLHITDAGALISDPINRRILARHVMDKELVTDVLTSLTERTEYVEVYTADDYFIEKGQSSKIIDKRVALLEKYPIIVDSLIDIASRTDVIKIEPISVKRDKVEELLVPFQNLITLSWTSNPTMSEYHEGIITKKDVSKGNAVLEVVKYLNIPFSEILTIGYSVGHWEFMQKCGFIGVIGNNFLLRELATSKGEGKYAIGRSVNEHGFLDVLDYFGLIKLINRTK